MLPGCLFGLPLNKDAVVRPSGHRFHYTLWAILLQHKALQTKEHWRHLPMHAPNMPGETYRKNHQGLCRQGGCQNQTCQTVGGQPPGHVCQLTRITNQTQSGEMQLQSPG